MSSQRVTFDPANLPRPENMGQRRGYIEQYIQRFHSNLVPKIAEKRQTAFPVVCKFYHEQRGKTQVPAVYFEYTIDKTMWKNIFKPQTPPEWPWSKGPNADDMSAGWSRRYREWRVENGLSIAPQQEVGRSSGNGKAAEKTTKPVAPNTQTRNGESSKSKSAAPRIRIGKGGSHAERWCGIKHKWVRVPLRLAGLKQVPMQAPKDLPEGAQSLYESLGQGLRESLTESVPPRAASAPKAPSTASAPKAPSATNAPRAPSAAGALSTREKINNPLQIDLSMREAAWSSRFGDRPYVGGAIYGAFALRLPGCLDFEYLVLGEDGRDIDAINNDILEPGLAISWKSHDGKAIALVLGFKDKAGQALPGAEANLFALWCDVVAWYVDALAGGTVSLATTLRVVQVVSYCRDRAPKHEQANASYYHALGNKLLILELARNAREDVLKWSPMVKAIIEKPLGEAEVELRAWVCDKDAGMEDCYRRLRVAHQVWLSSSADPKVIRRATNCLDDCSLALASA
ncbi:hypothetical protein FOVG_10159 [Fusarium oxysporum f. sp. pisi HDV247]|uniref:Uncharacterized protein n=1 Tax=Fusarium oxysporum f. sp. pisi HDV247 TaxID=1080344 RepID=W9P5C6_FUSOX|nr:hypothetical protein FOVG_10159 [Fusarium oxysporum f. sp. pisi HDV247]